MIEPFYATYKISSDTNFPNCVCAPVADRMKPISVDSFRDHVNKMHEERDKGFEAEYQVTPSPSYHSW